MSFIAKSWTSLLKQLYGFLTEIQYRKYLLQKWNNDIGYKRRYGYLHVLANSNARILMRRVRIFLNQHEKSFIKKVRICEKVLFSKKCIKLQFLKRILLFLKVTKNISLRKKLHELICVSNKKKLIFCLKIKNSTNNYISTKLENDNYRWSSLKNNFLEKIKKWRRQPDFNLFRTSFIDFKKEKYYTNPLGHFRDLKASRRRIRFFKKNRIAKLFSISLWSFQGKGIKKKGFFNIKHRAKQFIPIRHQLRRYYSDLSSRRFFNYFQSIKNIRTGARIGNFITKLEQRADVALLNYKIVPTTALAKRLISLGVVFENGKQITNYNYKIPIGNVLYIKKTVTTKVKLDSFSVIMSQFENSNMKMVKRRIMDVHHKKKGWNDTVEVFQNFFGSIKGYTVEHINKLQISNVLKKVFRNLISANDLLIDNVTKSQTKVYLNKNYFKLCRYFFDKKKRHRLRTISYKATIGKQECTSITNVCNRHLENRLFFLKNVKNFEKYKNWFVKKFLTTIDTTSLIGGILFRPIKETDKKESVINTMTMSRIPLKRYVL